MLLVVLLASLLTACAGSAQPAEQHEAERPHAGEMSGMSTPELAPVQLGAGERLNVVTTTSMIGDVVSQIGGEYITLSSVIGVGQDPHTYEPVPADIALLEQADVIFSNGLGFEEGLVEPLASLSGRVPVVPVSVGVDVLAGEGEHAAGDPHTWMDPRNVMIWVDNIAYALSALDPAHAETYGANAEAYRAQLEELDAYITAQVARIPEANRKLVTDHEALGYFARRYGFEVVGAVIPNVTTSAEPSAADLAALVETIRAEQVRAVFVSTSVSDELARTVAEEVGYEVRILYLYHELGEQGSGAETYLGMMRTDIDTIVAGLSS
jgi:ABC-type Zn uptake system ZnuABC Zn-binding protein ZnuA